MCSVPVENSVSVRVFYVNYKCKSSSRTVVLGSNQPLTEMSTRNLPGGKGRPARKPDNLTDFLENVAASTSHNPMGLHGLLNYSFTLFTEV
jgi:hypothetical protein